MSTEPVPTPRDLSLTQLVAINRSIDEHRMGADRAFANGQLRYGNELLDLAAEMVELLQALRPLPVLMASSTPTARRLFAGIVGHCATCGIKPGAAHWIGCTEGLPAS